MRFLKNGIVLSLTVVALLLASISTSTAQAASSSASSSVDLDKWELIVSVKVDSNSRNYNWSFPIKKGEKFMIEVDGSKAAQRSFNGRLKRDKKRAKDKNEYTNVNHGDVFTARGDHINSGQRFYILQESGRNVWVNIYKQR